MTLRYHWICVAGAILAFCGVARAQGVTDREILVGQFAAMSGPSAQLGQRLQAGIQAYFSSVNAQGGVAGRSLKLVTRDDGYEPEKAATAVKALISEDKVFALIGSVGTPTGLAALPIITEEKVPMVGMFTGAQALREPFNRQIFHVRASYYDETERIVQHLSTLGVSKIAVFYQNDAYGKAGLEGVKRALAKRQQSPVATATVERNSVDVAASVASIVAKEPQAVIQVGAYKACAAFIKEARKAGYGGQFFNVSFVGSKALADELGPVGSGVVVSQVVPFPFVATAPVVREYQQRMTEAGDKEFDFSSLEGYLTAKVFVEGLRRAGKVPTRESLINGLESIRDLNLGGFTINYSPKDHEGSRYTELTIIDRSGRFIH
jgi:ABC-type branched-subunit amino acid transport system substrate-binding protein